MRFATILLLSSCSAGSTPPTPAHDPPPDCSAEPQAPGCPCDADVPVDCYGAAAETLGVGLCRSGIQTCDGGAWSRCTGAVPPAPESCNGTDDDCDGTVDDGVLSACGTCEPCDGTCRGPDEGCDDWGDTGPGVARTPEDWLVLDGHSVTRHVVWPSSSASGEIFRVSSETMETEASFWTGPSHGGDYWLRGDSPSRSAVDDDGNVIIANRGFGGMSSVTKISGDSTACPDANGDGVVQTSTGRDDRLAFDSHERWADECILWHTVVGRAADAHARGVVLQRVFALDGALEGRVWIALHDEHFFQELEATTGEATGREAALPAAFYPYGAALDRGGFVWTNSTSGVDNVGRFDTADPADSFEAFDIPDAIPSRILVDENDAPWVSGFPDVYRFDRDTETWQGADLTGGNLSEAVMNIGGIASDGEGSIWVGSYDRWVYRVENDADMGVRRIPTPNTDAFGMAVDFDGHAWAFGWTTGNVTTIDLDDEETQVLLNDCGGNGCLHSPYVRGDATGLQRLNAVRPLGRWSTVFEGCPMGGTTWEDVSVDAQTPAGSSVRVTVQVADDLASLASAPRILLGTLPSDGPAFDLGAALDAAGVAHGSLLALEVVLQSAGGASPILRRVDTTHACDAGVE